VLTVLTKEQPTVIGGPASLLRIARMRSSVCLLRFIAASRSVNTDRILTPGMPLSGSPA
jgi:hypothetical protein